MDTKKCVALKAELQSQPEPQLVPIARFFDGNDDEGSIGCNLVPHPGVSRFRDTLLALLQRPDVDAAYALITELDPGENSWPFSDTVVIIGSISTDTLQAELAELQPDDVGPADLDGLGDALSQSEKDSAQVAWWDWRLTKRWSGP
jgi:hypothetical protein